MYVQKCHGCGFELRQPRKKNEHRDYCSMHCYDASLNRRFKTMDREASPHLQEETYSLSEIHNPFSDLFDRRGDE
jgi:hypothetical protein